MERKIPQPTFIDSHCHLADPAFAGRIPSVIRAAMEAGVMKFIVPAVEPGEWQRLLELQALHHGILPAFGLHPMHGTLFSSEMIQSLSAYRCAVAIGEIGLDYTLPVTREIQRYAFRMQLRLALQLDLPVLIHCRKAFPDLITTVKEETGGKIRGVMHAFSGSVETAVKCMEIGLHISLAGPVTFGNALRPVEVARQIPLDRLLLETDAPDLSPVPFRGRQNEPAFLPATARKIAEIKGIPLEQIAACTWQNAVDLFRLPV